MYTRCRRRWGPKASQVGRQSVAGGDPKCRRSAKFRWPATLFRVLCALASQVEQKMRTCNVLSGDRRHLFFSPATVSSPTCDTIPFLYGFERALSEEARETVQRPPPRMVPCEGLCQRVAQRLPTSGKPLRPFKEPTPQQQCQGKGSSPAQRFKGWHIFIRGSGAGPTAIFYFQKFRTGACGAFGP